MQAHAVSLVTDTGPLVALLDRGDEAHQRCTELLGGTDGPLVIPAPVLVEVDYFVPAQAFAALLADIRRGAFRVQDLELPDYARVDELVEAYADLHVGFVDAAVLAVVERLGERRLATLDHRHFGVMRPRHAAALELVPA